MTAKEHLKLHDREIAAIRKLLLEGMKMVRQYQDENRKFHRDVCTAVGELKDSHKKLVQALIKPTNGHKK